MNEFLQGLGVDPEAVSTDFVNACINLAGKIVACLLVLIIGRVLIRIIMKKLLTGKKIEEKMDTGARQFIRSLVNFGLNMLLVVIIVAILEIPTASIVTVIASAGAAIALSLQGGLSNFAGGIMLVIFKPFRVGNFVEFNSVSGTVTEIGIFYSKLKTPDGKHITVPNGTLISATITNYSEEPLRRVDIVANTAYGTDGEKVKATLLSVASAHEKVLKDPVPFARLTAMSDSSMDYTLRVWVKAEDFWEVKFDLLEAISKSFAEAGIEIPFPQMDVHVKND